MDAGWPGSTTRYAFTYGVDVWVAQLTHLYSAANEERGVSTRMTVTVLARSDCECLGATARGMLMVWSAGVDVGRGGADGSLPD
jgi:hypothetical protein